jgi:hypothetical protein
MTEQDKEIQELRRKVESLKEQIEIMRRRDKQLEQIHQLDMAEVVNMRRQVEAMERRNEP